ncbi:MAG: nucleoside deoxyribosyltransferase (endogenous virus) [Lactobacillus phage ViSo-2018a]|uniref:Nucleoside deoxyribosyltransferase n=1 Tax=Lactobacillus phage ViSo-2018a TaxID=2267607 RepID=A0A3G6JHV5_9CAUD|nr:MAG: nucleoside deoxyribosyltransferase [Lactobacillus phage ViSo-2018a]AZA17316.1 MAG: Nucleoside deoxyribosyltransferase [Lactobacillus phage ViSo-2018a]
MKTCYFCCGWFDENQRKAYKEAYQALLENDTIDMEHSYVPLEHQYKGIRVDEHPEYLRDKEWATATARGDLVGIKNSDVCVAIYLPHQEDVGQGFELGVAYQLGKYNLLVIPDEQHGEPINLMSWLAADKAIKLSELKDFDFNNLEFNFYDGSVY